MKRRRTLTYTADSETLARLDSLAPDKCACGVQVFYAWFGSTLRTIDAEPIDQPDLSVIVLGEHSCPAT